MSMACSESHQSQLVVEWVNGIGVVWQLEYFLSLRKNERFLNKEAHQNWKPWLCCPLWHNKYPEGLVGFHLLQNPINEIKGRKSIKILFPPVNKKSIYRIPALKAAWDTQSKLRQFFSNCF